jgi:hypothetical protein
VAVGLAISHCTVALAYERSQFPRTKDADGDGEGKDRASIQAGEVPRAREANAVLGADKKRPEKLGMNVERKTEMPLEFSVDDGGLIHESAAEIWMRSVAVAKVNNNSGCG